MKRSTRTKVCSKRSWSRKRTTRPTWATRTRATPKATQDRTLGKKRKKRKKEKKEKRKRRNLRRKRRRS